MSKFLIRFYPFLVHRRASFLIADLLLAAIITAPFAATVCSGQQRIAPPQALSERQDLAQRLSAIEQALETRRKALGIPGLSLVIVKDDRIVYIKGFGVRDLERKTPVTPDTQFAIASATKAFTAMAVMMSADEGKLALDDSPKKLLPFFKLRDPDADSCVTLRDLLTHQTGLNRTDLAMSTGKLSREELIRVAGFAKPTARLREKFQYQNVMYAAAGEAVAKANGTTWEKFIAGRIFKPLGMKSSNTSLLKMQKSKDFSFGYDSNPETKETKFLKSQDASIIGPAGSINSNARDMAQWLRLMLGGGVFDGKRLVSEKNFSELVTQQIQLAPKFGYGLGWFLREWRGRKEVYHGGNFEGFNSMVAMIPEDRLGFVMLGNVSISPLADEMQDIVFGNLLGQPEKSVTAAINPAAQSAGDLQREVGEYSLAGAALTIKVALTDGKLTLSVPNQPTVVLENVGGRRYKLAAPAPDGIFVTFRPAKSRENETELYLEQPQGSAVFSTVKSANENSLKNFLTRSSTALNLPTVEELMQKMTEAAGGEANLRRHNSMVIETTIDYENQGVNGERVVSAEAPNLIVTNTILFALGKKIGTTSEYFDGSTGGIVASFGSPFMLAGRLLENARIDADFYALLNWKTLYRKVTIKKMSKIGDEEVYVVEKTPASGHPITDYVSAKSSLVLRRETQQPMGAGDLTIPNTENFSDYKSVDGVMMPFKIVSNNPIYGIVTASVKSIRFNVEIPKSVFHPNLSAVDGK
jgi:CubicO group peptidase (beta-lactamase class C family)